MRTMLYTLDAAAIFNAAVKDKDGYSFAIDLNYFGIENQVVINKDNHMNNALFDQIRLAADNCGPLCSKSISNLLVIVDFTGIFRFDQINPESGYKGILKLSESEKEARGNALIENGFNMRFQGQNAFTKFRVFDKSASMSRGSRVSFIAEDILEEVDRRIRLDIDFSKIEGIPSKYYSYRGLYLSDGIRMDSKRLELNEKTVIVIPNEKHPLSSERIITVDTGRFQKDTKVIPLIPKYSETKLEITPFDGEGLISFRYKDILNQLLGIGKAENATSFQIRMPYTKGMLHTVDFKSFIQNQLHDVPISEMYIEDAYGIKRNLKDAEIILTVSMFKCFKWLESYILKDTYEKETANGRDPMAFFFSMFEKYGHAMYIVGTNCSLVDTGSIRMNYQFLNTIELKVEEMEQMMKEHFSSVRKLSEDVSYAREKLHAFVPDAVTYEDENVDESKENIPTWKYALSKNRAFLQDRRIQNIIKKMQSDMIREVCLGGFEAEGLLRFLSDDLLMFLIKLLGRVSDGTGQKYNSKEIHKLSKEILYSDKFYMPGHETFDLYHNNHYALLRSPHLSRNELCALKPYTPSKSNVYELYFGHLQGVIMLSYDSSAPAVLAGADFDGDLVKLMLNKTINKAIIRTAYETVRKGTDPRKKALKRKYPIAKIPAVNELPVFLGEGHATYLQLKNTFSNRVGEISNLAIKIGKTIYADKTLSSDEQNICALCTIATGLEIDAVKTGARPDITILRNYAVNNSADTFFSIKDCLDDVGEFLKKAGVRMPDYGYTRKWTIHSKENENMDGYSAYVILNGKNHVLFTASKPDSSGIGSQIEYLPYYYLRELANSSTSRKNRMKEEPCFSFELDQNWREKCYEDKRIADVKMIIGAYRKTNSDIATIKAAKKRYDNALRINRIIENLIYEYDTQVDPFPIGGIKIEVAIEKMYTELLDAFKDVHQIKDVINRARQKDIEWLSVVNYDSRKQLLLNILGLNSLSESSSLILCDTYMNGYQNLENVLMDIYQIKYKEQDPEMHLKKIKTRWQRDYDPKLHEILFKCYDIKASTDIWKRKMQDICRQVILELFDGSAEMAVRFAYAAANEIDETHMFFWDVFRIQDIEPVLVNEDSHEDTPLQSLSRRSGSYAE